MTFFGLTQDFLTVLREKGSSANTLCLRERWLRRLRRFCERHEVRRPEDLDEVHLAGFQGELASSPGLRGNLSPNSLCQALMTVRGFLRWAHREGYLVVDPSRNLIIPRPPAPFRPLLTQDEVRRLLETPRADTLIGLRDRALLELLYGTGVRRSEAAGLDLSDLDLRGAVLLVRRGKGSRDRMLPLGRHLVEVLERYLTEARPKLLSRPEESALLLDLHGARLDLILLHQRVAKHGRRACLGSIGPHRLRYAFASHLMENGAEVTAIQALLGHAGIRTTQRYLLLRPVELKRVHHATHPRARLTPATRAQLGLERTELVLDCGKERSLS